ncbi:unnamed protein product, partial [Symbiodinium microadriaticum]
MSRQGRINQLQQVEASYQSKKDCDDGDVENGKCSTVELRMLRDREKGNAWIRSFSSDTERIRRRTVTI